MAKVGLKDTLALLAKGYSKKEIDALAAIDEESNQEEQPVVPDEDKDADPAPGQAQEKDQDPDYKKMYEELLKEKEAKEKEIKDKDEQIKEIQKDNIHEDNLSEVEKGYEEEQASLIDAIRSFY